MRHVITIAYECEANIPQISKPFLQGEVVRQRLARMLEFAESVDHRDTCMLCHGRNRGMVEGAQHNDIHPALQVACNVAKALARVNAALSLYHDERDAAQAGHASRESQTCSERGLFQK